MCAEGITLFDRRWESRTDDRSPDSRLRGSPLKRIGLNAMLVGVGCCKNVVNWMSPKWTSARGCTVRVVTQSTPS